MNEALMSLVVPILTSTLALIIGYFIFRTNVNNSLETMNKDIIKNDERIRKELREQVDRDAKHDERVEQQLASFNTELNKTANRVLETTVNTSHLQKSVDSMMEKIDIILKSLTNNRRSGDEKP